MHAAFDLLALAQEHRTDREREARLERMRPRPAEPRPPRAQAPAEEVSTECPAAAAACQHATAA